MKVGCKKNPDNGGAKDDAKLTARVNNEGECSAVIERAENIRIL